MAELEPQSPQSCEQLETGHPEVYQEDQKHSKYVEVRGGAKEESRRSRGIRPPRAGQAARLGCRMTDGRFKTGHHWNPETRQGFTRVGTELQEWSLAEKGAQRQQLKADPITMKQKEKQGGKEADIYVIWGK